jgi:hypothetical protein
MDSAPRMVGPEAIRLGRSPKNDFVLDEPTVSSRHAEVFWEADRLFLIDLGSRNGTTVNGEVVHANTSRLLKVGDVIRFGDAEVKVGSDDTSKQVDPLMLHDLDGGVMHCIRGGSIQIGGGKHAHVPIDGAEEVMVVADEDGAVYLSGLEGLDGGRVVMIGEEFSVGGQRFQVQRRSNDVTGDTVVIEDPEPPERCYRLEVTLNGVVGPEARLTDPSTGTRYVVSAENRAILLWVLSNHRLKVLSDNGTEDRTWCLDSDVTRAIWGKRGTADANSLHVLVHRLRKELRRAGFDPWFIEKRRKAIRVALRDVTLE